MTPKRVVGIALAVAILLAVTVPLAMAYVPATLTDTGETYEAACVSVVDEDGTLLGVVRASVADTADERYTGLSETASLANGSGMLFVYPTQGERAFVMRDMEFPLDMVFVAANGTITTIHHAPVPPEGTEGEELERYRGEAKWVLEVPRGWTDARGVSVGDRLRIAYLRGETTTATANDSSDTANTSTGSPRLLPPGTLNRG